MNTNFYDIWLSTDEKYELATCPSHTQCDCGYIYNWEENDNCPECGLETESEA